MFDEESGLQETEIFKYTPVITLDSLPKCRHIEYICPDAEYAQECLKAVVKGDLKSFRKLIKDKAKGEWMKWIYGVDLTLYVADDGIPDEDGGRYEEEVDGDAKFRAELTLIHMVIICQQLRMLQLLLGLAPTHETFRKVKVSNEKGLKIKKKERWIFGANCVHLSAKYLPTGLRHLLSIEEIKDKLLNKGSEQFQITPLHVSCLDQADSTSTKILLNFGALVEAKDSKGCTPLFYAAKENALENLLDLLEMGGADPNHRAKNGKTALFKAHSYECALLLLQNKAQAYEGRSVRFRKTVRNANRPDTPFSYLVRHHAGAAEAILDESLDVVNEDLFIYDFEQFKNVSEVENEMDFHFILKENGKSELLLHPLMEIFLHMKWTLMNASMIVQILFNVFFVIFLTSLGQYYLGLTTCQMDSELISVSISTSDKNYQFEVNPTCTMAYDNGDGDLKNLTCEFEDFVNETFKCHKYSIRTNYERPYPLQPICDTLDLGVTCWWLHWNTIFVILLLLGMTVREILELRSKSLISYFWSMENVIQLLIIGFTTAFLGFAYYDIEISYHFGAISLFLAWMDLTLFIGRLDYFGEYMYIILNVGKTLLKCLTVYIPIILAFAFSFNMLLHSDKAFNSYASTILKVIVMMLGELEFSDHFQYDQVDETGGRNFTIQLFFVLFVVFVSIIVMNLLVALTVSATGKLREEGEIIQAEKRMKDIVKDAKMIHKHPIFTKFGALKEKWFGKSNSRIMGPDGQLAKRTTTKICVKYSETLKPTIIEHIRNIWRGGPYPIFSYDFKKDKPFKINVPLHIIDKTKAGLEKKAKRRQEFEAKIHTIKAKSLKGLEANANTSVPYVMQKSNSLIMMSKSGSSLDLHLDVLKSRLKDLKTDIAKISEVLDNMSFDEDETEA